MVTFSFERGTAFVSEMLESMSVAELVAVAKRCAAPRGTTPASAASSGTWPPTSTRCGR